jgi:hypothetical protein
MWMKRVFSTVQKTLAHFRAKRTETSRRYILLGTWTERYCCVFSWYLWELYPTNDNLSQETNVLIVEKQRSYWSPLSFSNNWWITEELFFEWLLYLKQFAKPQKYELVLIIGTPTKIKIYGSEINKSSEDELGSSEEGNI